MTAMTRDGADVGRQLPPSPQRMFQSPDEQLHEVRASVAGLSRAVHLLVHHGTVLPERRKRRLESLLVSEVSRLERLLFEQQPHQDAATVADVIAPVVDARQLAGQVIDWRPSPSTALCVRDFLAEAVNILLANAAKHAGGSPTAVEIVDAGEDVQIHVSDRGPGIPQPLRDRVFEPGFRGGAVEGNGLGLAVARRLMAAQDGSVHLADGAGPGATFVLSLPRQRRPT